MNFFFQGRVRVLALIVKLFSISRTVASVVYKSNLLSLLVEEVRNVNDMLITLSVLELLYEVWHQPLFYYNFCLLVAVIIKCQFSFLASSSHIVSVSPNSMRKVCSLSRGRLMCYCFICNATTVCLTCSCLSFPFCWNG